MINVNAHELAYSPRTPQLPELCNKSGWISSEADNGPVDIDHECMRTVYLRSRGQSDV